MTAMGRRSKQDASATREQLLDAAEQLFIQNGLERTSLQQIACAAGLTRGAVYWHFADKLALVEALLARVDAPLRQALAAAAQQIAGVAADRAADPLSALRRLALAPFELIDRDASAKRVFTIMLHCGEFVGELAPLARYHQRNWEDWTGNMARLFEAAQAGRMLAEGTVAADCALALLSLVDGLLRRRTLRDGQAPTPQAVAAAIDALIEGCRRPAPATPPRQGC